MEIATGGKQTNKQGQNKQTKVWYEITNRNSGWKDFILEVGQSLR